MSVPRKGDYLGHIRKGYLLHIRTGYRTKKLAAQGIELVGESTTFAVEIVLAKLEHKAVQFKAVIQRVVMYTVVTDCRFCLLLPFPPDIAKKSARSAPYTVWGVSHKVLILLAALSLV